jgi:hypothetical protein
MICQLDWVHHYNDVVTYLSNQVDAAFGECMLDGKILEIITYIYPQFLA